MDASAKIGIGISVGLGFLAVSGVTALAYKLLFSKQVPQTLTDPAVKVSLLLVDAYNVTHDTKMFIFKLPSPDHTLGIKTGQHVYFSAKIDGELTVRPYTPISSTKTLGQVEFIIKVYKPNEKFKAGGKMSQYLDSLIPGQSYIDFRGPNGKIVYNGCGKFSITKTKTNILKIKVNKISLIAGGTGITPMYQMIEQILKDENDKTEIKLLFANNSENDIIMREYLDNLAKNHPSQFKVWYTITSADENWRFSTGFINQDMIKNHLFPPSDDNIVFLCGPPPMLDYACKPNLDKLNYTTDKIFTF